MKNQEKYPPEKYYRFGLDPYAALQQPVVEVVLFFVFFVVATGLQSPLVHAIAPSCTHLLLTNAWHVTRTLFPTVKASAPMWGGLDKGAV